MAQSSLSGTAQKKTLKSGDVSWIQYWYDARGKRHNCSADTKRKAVDAANKKLKELNQDAMSDETRFEEFATTFLKKSAIGREGRRAMDPDTTHSYEHYLKTYVNPFLGNKLLTRITTSTMREFMEHLIANTKTRTTASKIFTVTKTILRYAVTLELISVVPGDTLKITKDWHAAEQHKIDRIPTEAEMRKIEAAALACYHSNNGAVKKAYRRYFPLFMILRTTGVRISEALGLQWGDFNAAMDRVTIKRRVSIPAEYKDEEDRIARPKTKNGVRTIPISSAVQEVLRVWKSECQHEWLFSVANGNPMNYSNVRNKFWVPLLERAGVELYGLHSLRHYYASLLIAAGRYKVLTHLLGHHSAAFTMDTYGHLLRGSADVMDEIAESVSIGL